VRSSLSFPIMLGGNLVALIACHHTEARTLSLPRLEQVSQKLRAYCLSLASKQTQRRMNLLDGLTHRFSETRMILRGHDDLFSAWPEMGQWLMREFQAAGAALCFDDQVTGVGTLFEPEALQAVDAKFCTDQSDLVWSADSLHRQVPAFPPSEIAGVMGLRIGRPGGGSGAGGIRIYLTRSEHIHEVAWGGNPDKPVEFHDGAFGIAPRRSFEKWIEKRLGYCRAWNSEERLLMLKLRELLLQELRF